MSAPTVFFACFYVRYVCTNKTKLQPSALFFWGGGAWNGDVDKTITAPYYHSLTTRYFLHIPTLRLSAPLHTTMLGKKLGLLHFFSSDCVYRNKVLPITTSRSGPSHFLWILSVNIISAQFQCYKCVFFLNLIVTLVDVIFRLLDVQFPLLLLNPKKELKTMTLKKD